MLPVNRKNKSTQVFPSVFFLTLPDKHDNQNTLGKVPCCWEPRSRKDSLLSTIRGKYYNFKTPSWVSSLTQTTISRHIEQSHGENPKRTAQNTWNHLLVQWKTVKRKNNSKREEGTRMVGNEENFQTNEEQYSGLILRCRDTKLRQSPKLALKTPTSLYSMIKLQPTLYFR